MRQKCKKTFKDKLNPEWNLVSNNSEDIEYGVPNYKTNWDQTEVENLRTYDIIIDDFERN